MSGVPYSSSESLPSLQTIPWAVSATHTNLNQSITSSAALTTSNGTAVTYITNSLNSEHNIVLPKPGSTAHFVSPQQPIFTFTQPTRVFMIIPTTTNTVPLVNAGWIFSPQVGGPARRLPALGMDDVFTGVISGLGADYLYERFYDAGTHNLDPTGLAPEAFFLFEEVIDFDILAELRARQMHWFENGLLPNDGGNYAVGGLAGTQPTDPKLHVEGKLRASGSLEAGKNTDQVCHLGRGRIGHFPVTNANTGVTSSSVSFSHHDCDAATNFALVQTEDGETIVNSAAGKHMEFMVGGVAYMRVGYTDSNGASTGYIGINQAAPAEYLDVGGNIKASGNVIATNIKNYYQTTNSANSTVADSSDSVNQVTNAGCPSSESVWTRYMSWKTSGSDYTNSNTNVFSPQNYGFKALVAGTYKITVHMTFQTFRSNQNVVIRLAKGALVDDVDDSDNENPGPLANMFINSYQNAGKIHSIGCAQITHIMSLAANDEVSVYTVQVGYNDPAGNNVHTRQGYSQFLAEYLG